MVLKLLELPISDNTQLVLGVVACFGVAGLINWTYSKRSLPLPPSPPTWRLLGHFLPFQHSFLIIASWIDEYGPLVTIRAVTEKVVIIGRYKAAVEIMEKQGGALGDRPRMIAAGEILSGGQSMGFMHAGDKFRRMRSALHTHLQPKAAEAYQPLQMSHAKHTVLDILDDPYNFQTHTTTYAASTILKIAYGKTTRTSATDPEVREILLRPGAYLVESMPWLKHVPWYGKDLKQQYERTKELYTNQLNHVRQQLQSDVDAGPSFARYMLEHNHLYNLTETEKAFLGGALFAAGSDTTSVAICTIFITAARFPEEQAKVQAELDTVIGRHRVPTFADQKSLPRLEAFILEALRWRPLASNGFAHRTTRDVIWENYCIPAGTTVLGNHWAISRDPEVYPDPDAFKPQRWIDDQGRVRDEPKFFTYGFGRRSLFISSLLVLWAFHLTQDTTKPLNGWGFLTAMLPTDKPYAIDFKTRFSEVDLRRMLQNDPDVA
ncbi:cytochrome P450 [Suillus occidentalis]|nr:cytochrome P450 [Suillus occidentalis]